MHFIISFWRVFHWVSKFRGCYLNIFEIFFVLDVYVYVSLCARTCVCVCVWGGGGGGLMNVDWLGADVSICLQLGGEYVLVLNVVDLCGKD